MAWKEYGETEVPDKKTDVMAVVLIVACLVSLGMYVLGKSDGKSDALKSTVENCVTVEILEDS